jgi:hypothetical protein
MVTSRTLVWVWPENPGSSILQLPRQALPTLSKSSGGVLELLGRNVIYINKELFSCTKCCTDLIVNIRSSKNL